MDVRTVRIRFSRFTGRYYPLLLLLWSVTLGVLAVLAAAWPLARSLGWGHRVPGAVILLGGPGLLTLGVVLACWFLLLLCSPPFSFWYSRSFRYLAWTAIRVLTRA